MVDPEILLRIPLFSQVNAGALRELAARSILRSLPRDRVLWHAGEEPRGLVVIIKGMVKVFRTVQGRQHVVHVEGAGGTLGDVAMFEDRPFPASAVTIAPTLLLTVTRDGLRAAIRQDPELAFSLLARLAARVRHVIGRLDGLAARSVSARLAGYLLERRERTGLEPFTLGGSHRDVAEQLGTVREVLGRNLRGLRDRGLITIGANGGITIVDGAGLRAVVDE
ncbi:MAG TPA: Crp/Fnr family transcriptional regulator [Longimicrobium sp.]|nr:Crp/Fnr family transcriptional regulator [Longimicrobium sp.]